MVVDQVMVVKLVPLAAQEAVQEMIVVDHIPAGPVQLVKDLLAVLVQHLHTKKQVVVVVVPVLLGPQPLQVPVAQVEMVAAAFNIV